MELEKYVEGGKEFSRQIIQNTLSSLVKSVPYFYAKINLIRAVLSTFPQYCRRYKKFSHYGKSLKSPYIYPKIRYNGRFLDGLPLATILKTLE